MPYSELIKNFEKIRNYMREFYVYGFKSRSEYSAKSPRSYDDERRRIESWLGDHVRSTRGTEGKNVFLYVDSRAVSSNPLYRAWRSKSFTDGDITLHFILFDILYRPDIKKTLTQLLSDIDSYLREFAEPMTFDESTVRKKLKEYTENGIIKSEKAGRTVLYSRTDSTDISALSDLIDFFSEVAPCGVIGSFLQDRFPAHVSPYNFKHHYITSAIDSDILAQLFDAIGKKCYISVTNHGKHSAEPYRIRLIPLKIYISAQNGRQNLIAWQEQAERFNSYRIDNLSDIRIENSCTKFDKLRAHLKNAETHMWGVNCSYKLKHPEHVEFTVKINDNEQYIIRRLEREKRCGKVEKIDEHNYRYIADVFDTNEMVPWIRTFICRITRMNFSNRTIENRFKNDLQKMYCMYGIDGGVSDDIQ